MLGRQQWLILLVEKDQQVLKLNTFANFERPSKIDLLELFLGRLKGYVHFFCQRPYAMLKAPVPSITVVKQH
jgi:hypothetical protein